MIDPDGLKTCFKCGIRKHRSNFYRHSAMADGLLGKCKDCTKVDVRAHRIENSEAVREYDRKRSRTRMRLEDRQSRNSAYAKMNPEKRAAHHALGNAVRDGRVKKRPCAFCGSEDRLDAHHHDYSKPLDVTWLCAGCHRRFHALERMATYDRGAA